MRFILITWLFFSFFTLEAQYNQSESKIKPAGLVKSQKRLDPSFKSYQLFSKKKLNRKNNSSTHYETLQLNKDQFSDLSKLKPSAITLEIPSNKKDTWVLELVQVPILSDDFQVQTSSGAVYSDDIFQEALFYRGIVKGNDQSIASFSFVEGEIVGMISTPESGNVSLEREGKDSEEYRIYDESMGTKLEEFYCEVKDEGVGYNVSELSPTTKNVEQKCTKIYFEIDHDIYLDKGSVNGVVDYVTSLFNEVATLYANDQIKIEISEIFIWDQPSPYNGRSSLEMLNLFQTTRTSFNGDLAQLLSYKTSGGIAVVGGLCHPVSAAKMSFASVEPTFSRVPSYTFTVLVVAHELGHLFGSMHTHACVWNGNNTAIDGCAGYVEGSCPNDKGVPSDGGTIMSYCHLTSAGTNFSFGFGMQPGNLIRNRVANASCLSVCNTDSSDDDDEGGSEEDKGKEPSACTDANVDFTLLLDDYPMEVVWVLEDEDGRELYSGGPYVKEMANQEIKVSFCLLPGTYTFIIEDFYGDGLCCGYGEGYYLIEDKAGKMITSGSQYSDKKVTHFTIGEEDPPISNECVKINFNDYPIEPYGGVQDRGTHQIKHGGRSIKLIDSAWKAVKVDYNVNSETILEFDFASTQIGDIHAIGLDDDNIPSGTKSFKIFGLQDWGVLDFDDYQGNSVWKKYRIPIGQYFTGAVDRLFFISDDDFGEPRGNSYFRDIKIYDGTDCAELEEINLGGILDDRDASFGEEDAINIAPNPAKNHLILDFYTFDKGNGRLAIYNMNEVPILNKEVVIHRGNNSFELELPYLPTGFYIAELELNGKRMAQKIEIVN